MLISSQFFIKISLMRKEIKIISAFSLCVYFNTIVYNMVAYDIQCSIVLYSILFVQCLFIFVCLFCFDICIVIIHTILFAS